jgi:Cdc6-like AAA superfamily ATPase
MKIENVKTIKDLKINTKREWNFPIPHNLPPNDADIPFFNGLLVGSRGSGKSFLCLKLLENLKSYYSKFYVISPTRLTDRKVKIFFENLEEIKKIEYFDELNEDNLEFILHDLKEDVQLFKKYLKVKYVIDIIKKGGLKKLSDDDLAEIMDMLIFDEDNNIILDDLDTILDGFPNYIKNDYPPMSIIVIDDCYGCKLLSKSQGTNSFTQYWIKHRHYFCSNMIMVQSISGVPRSIRSNTTLFCCFGVKSKKDRDVLHSEVDNIFPNKNEFYELMDESDRMDYGFLYMDTSSLKNPDIRLTLEKKIQL